MISIQSNIYTQTWKNLMSDSLVITNASIKTIVYNHLNLVYYKL